MDKPAGRGDDIVVVEPDGLPDIVRGCLNQAQIAERYQLLQYAMKQLGVLPHAREYLDAGNPGMFANPAPLAGPLGQAGIRHGRGFSANVSNFRGPAWSAGASSWNTISAARSEPSLTPAATATALYRARYAPVV